MANIEFFERFAGAFLLWLAALIVSLYSFFSSIPLYSGLSLGAGGLFLIFFLTWGLVFTFFYTLVALYFRFRDMCKGTEVPQPPHRAHAKKRRK